GTWITMLLVLTILGSTFATMLLLTAPPVASARPPAAVPPVAVLLLLLAFVLVSVVVTWVSQSNRLAASRSCNPNGPRSQVWLPFVNPVVLSAARQNSRPPVVRCSTEPS